jgi:hypothetical protein
MESVSTSDGLGMIGGFSTTGADDRVESVDVGEALVDDWLVDTSQPRRPAIALR